MCQYQFHISINCNVSCSGLYTIMYHIVVVVGSFVVLYSAIRENCSKIKSLYTRVYVEWHICGGGVYTQLVYVHFTFESFRIILFVHVQSRLFVWVLKTFGNVCLFL